MNIHLIPNIVNDSVRVAEELPIGIQTMNIPVLWEKSNKGKGNVIAIIDSGCEVTHPELKDNIIGGLILQGMMMEILIYILIILDMVLMWLVL